MEKNYGAMQTKRIVITGPESTGKSELTKKLGEHFKMPYINEIARDYIENLNRNYTKNDVIQIAKLQVEEENKLLKQNPEYLFIDTDLIITKIWLIHVYGNYPKWIDEKLITTTRFCHLLCYYDLEWVYDPVRENSNLREFLFDKYKSQIEQLKIPYKVIKGRDDYRLKSAVEFIGNLE